MMKREDWLKAIVQTAKKIASREYQEEHWFRGQRGREWADEVFLDLDGYAFDLFFETYSQEFNEAQRSAWIHLAALLDSYERKLPRFPHSETILNDPQWQQVRDASTRFVAAFE